MALRKPQPHLYCVSLHEHQQAIQWIAGNLRDEGYLSAEARLVPEWGYWLFYDSEGNLLIRVDHADVMRVTAVFETLHQREMDARIDALLKEPKREW